MTKQHIEDLIGTWWTYTLAATDAQGNLAAFRVKEVRITPTAGDQVLLNGSWQTVKYNGGGTTITGWVQRKPLAPPDWRDVRAMIHDYLVRLQQLGRHQPFLQRFLTSTIREFDPERDQYEMGS